MSTDFEYWTTDEEISDREQLLLEFEKMLNDEDNEYETKKTPMSYNCDHNWVKTGESPLSGKFWYNCKNCKLPREEYESNR